MARPELGVKRQCMSCGAKFYDLNKDPIICPRCNTVHQPEQILKPRRNRPDDKAAAVVPKPAPEPVDADAVDEAEEDAFIEDASELGEDEDMSDVIESDLDEEQR